MKTIIVYFSLDGNTKYAADIIAEQLNADILRLEPVKEYPKGNFSKFFWGGKSVIFGNVPKLVPYQFEVEKYDLIILGTPVWAGSFTPPLKTFIRNNDLSNKKVAFFACNSGGDADQCFTKLKQEIPKNDILATLSLTQPKVNQAEENLIKINEFCNRLKV